MHCTTLVQDSNARAKRGDGYRRLRAWTITSTVFETKAYHVRTIYVLTISGYATIVGKAYSMAVRWGFALWLGRPCRILRNIRFMRCVL